MERLEIREKDIKYKLDLAGNLEERKVLRTELRELRKSMFETSVSSINIEKDMQKQNNAINYTFKKTSQMRAADTNNNSCVIKTQENSNENPSPSMRRRVQDDETTLRTAADRAARRAKRAQQLNSTTDSPVNIALIEENKEKAPETASRNTELLSKPHSSSTSPSPSGLRRTATWSPSNRQSAIVGIKSALNKFTSQESGALPEFGTSYIKSKNDVEEKEQKIFVTNKYTPTVPGISIDKIGTNVTSKNMSMSSVNYSDNAFLNPTKDNEFRNVNTVSANNLLESKSWTKTLSQTYQVGLSNNENVNIVTPSMHTLQNSVLNRAISTSQNNLQATTNSQTKNLNNDKPFPLNASVNNRFSQNVKEESGTQRENPGTFSSVNSALNQVRLGSRSPVPLRASNLYNVSSLKSGDQSITPSKALINAEKDLPAPTFNENKIPQSASERMAFFRQAAEEEKFKEEKQKEREQKEREQKEREQKARNVEPPVVEKKEDEENESNDMKDSEKMKYAAPCMKKREKKKVVRRTMSIGSIVLDWVQEMVKDYPVEVKNFSSSWNDGMVFCALIHRFNPTEFDFNLLKPENKRENFNTAFETGKRVKNIPILLDTEDMVRMDKPEPRSVQCYVQWIWSVYGPTSGYGPTPGEVQT